MSKYIRLPKFLEDVDFLIQEMSNDQMRNFIHEMARILPEKDRTSFYKKLIAFQGSNKGEEEMKVDLSTEIENTIEKLKEISEGDRQIDSCINEEWDDWYDDNETDEFLFDDNENIADDIQKAVDLISKCIDYENYGEDVKRLLDIVFELEVYVSGDYDEYCMSTMGIEALYTYNILKGDYDKFLNNCLYLIYMCNELPDRAHEMFCVIADSQNKNYIRLENVLQVGNSELPDFDEFLIQWMQYLGISKESWIERFLQEAQSLMKSDDIMFENARKYAKTHPNLYVELLENKKNSDNDRKMLETGLEALGLVEDYCRVRADIALLTAEYAEKTGEYEKKYYCWIEAFRSDSTVINYMRIRFETESWEKYRHEIRQIIDNRYEDGDYIREFGVDKNTLQENVIDKYGYCIFMFFEHEYEKMIITGMKTSKYLGWSETFMKQGISFLLLLMYEDNDLPVGLTVMQERVISACNFKAEKYYLGTGKSADADDIELFEKLFMEWKKDVVLTENERQTWLRKVDSWLKKRTKAIMENNRRNYYAECASFIAALGEVLESLGNNGAKERTLQAYKREYPRRSAFHRELRRFGMKK